MAILNESKQRLEELYGKPKKATLLVGGEEFFVADEALCYSIGRYQVTVGLLRGVSRYASFSKERRDDTDFTEDDVDVCLHVMDPEVSWYPCQEVDEEQTHVIRQYEGAITNSAGQEIEVTAFHRKTRPHLLAFTHQPEEGTMERLAREMNEAQTLEAKVEAMRAVINELLAERGETAD